MSYTPKTLKERKLHRLKIIQGHLKKVIEMVDHDDYCIDILNQSQAIQNALKEVDSLILENHLRTCAIDAIKSGKSEEAIVEIMKVLDKKPS